MLTFQLMYFPRETITRRSIISSESVKIRKRKSRWVSDFRRACGFAIFATVLLLHSMSPFFVMPVFSMRAHRIQHRHNLRKKRPGKRDWFRRDFLKLAERSLKLRRREMLIRNSLGGDTDAVRRGNEVRSFRDCLPC